MAEKKERQFVKASTGEKVSRTTAAPKAERREKATGKRIAAFVCWLIALACEVFVILSLNKTVTFGPYTLYVQIGLIVLDLILCIVGAQLWKRANDVDPASKANSVKYFLWTQMGLIAAAICLAPLVLYLVLKRNDLDKKTKKLLLPIAAVALVAACLLSVDWNPISEEDYNSTVAEIGTNTTVYYTQWGKSYHLNPDCQALKRSSLIFEGTIEDALNAGRNDPCDFCVPQH